MWRKEIKNHECTMAYGDDIAWHMYDRRSCHKENPSNMANHIFNWRYHFPNHIHQNEYS